LIVGFSLSFHPTASTLISTLSLHDALPIYHRRTGRPARHSDRPAPTGSHSGTDRGRREHAARGHREGQLLRGQPGHPRSGRDVRSEEHTSELQSRENLVCRLLLEKKKIKNK